MTCAQPIEFASVSSGFHTRCEIRILKKLRGSRKPRSLLNIGRHFIQLCDQAADALVFSTSNRAISCASAFILSRSCSTFARSQSWRKRLSISSVILPLDYRAALVTLETGVAARRFGCVRRNLHPLVGGCHWYASNGSGAVWNWQGWHPESACGKLISCQSLHLRPSMTKPKGQLRGNALVVKLFSRWTV